MKKGNKSRISFQKLPKNQILFFVLAFFFISFFSLRASNLFTGSSTHINKIIQDHAGYIWLATDNGLTRYDGYNVKTFTRANTPSLLSNTILTVFEDKKSQIWIGTQEGIQKLVKENETFETPRLSYPGIPEFSYVNSIIEDSKGNLWFTTSRSGLVCFSSKDRKPTCYMPTNSNICSEKTTVVFEDKFGNIWVGSNDNGLTLLNPENNTMVNFRHDPSDPSSLSGNMIYSVAQTNDGQIVVASLDGGIDSYSYRTHKFTRNAIPVRGKVFVMTNDKESNSLYIGTDGNGILRYDFDSALLTPLVPDVKDFDITTSKVHDIFKDRRGNLWAAVYQRGALVIPSHATGVENLGFNPFNSSINIGNEPVLSILKDSSSNLWIGTDGDGVYVKDDSRSFRHVKSETDPEIVMCLFEDSRGDIWAGSYLGGLYKYDRGRGHFTPCRPEINGKHLGGTINTIEEDSDGSLWLGTNGNGIYVYNPVSGETGHLYHSADKAADIQIAGNAIHAICFDRSGNVWIGTSDAGISMLNGKTGKFQHYNLSNRRLNNNSVYSIAEDRSGNIWTSTGSGLVCISEGKSTFYTSANGIPEETIYGLLLDGEGDLWFSNIGGINCFSTKEKKTVKKYSSSRLGCREFKRGASFYSDDGRIYFGGVGGTVSFLPKEFSPSSALFNIRINDITLLQDSPNATSQVIPVFEGADIKLDHKHNSFTVTFGAFEFIAPEDVVYSVLLENYSDSWLAIPQGTQYATFSEIPPGTYVLKVKAILGDSEQVTELPLTITPPFYKTTLAKTGYVFLIILILSLIYWSIRNKNRSKTEHRRLLQEERIKEEKLQFFTDISHEVRTPLTLILSPLSTLKKSVSDKKLINTFEMMESNGERILRMIDQVIDLRKFDNNFVKLHLSPTDIREFIKKLCESFSNIIAIKKIQFSLNFSDEVPESVLIDRDKADKVVFNVLANACRFTPMGGTIKVSVDVDGNNSLRIRISDSGPGIDPALHEAIFERFYQVKSGENTGGTGIGLHLSKKMMEAHHGSIFVESSGQNGSTFAIILPLDPEKYRDDEIINNQTVEEHSPVILEKIEPGEHLDISGLSKSHTILIIEDDVSIINYLTTTLSRQYNVISASDGDAGLEAVLRHRPHCVITDIMLNGIDGLEICRKIRSNGDTCDIPVIILTAKATEEQRIAGLEAGADAYIVKPFNIDHLRTRISNLIQSRRIMKEKFTNTPLINEKVVGVKSADQKLLDRIENVVVAEISNPDLSVAYIADKIGVSRSHLHRKLKELTNINPVAYIKQARMKHAVILLTEKGMSVSEVAFATGFNSLSHFSTVFKEFYGMSPTKYIHLNPPEDKNENI